MDCETKAITRDCIEDVTVNEVIKPILVHWDHGAVLSEEPSEVQCEILTKKDNPNVVVPVVSTQKYGNVYVGKKEPFSDLCQNFLVVRNKTTRKMKLYAVDSYFMSQYRHNDETTSIVNEEKQTTSNKEAILKLNQTFASKKIRRRNNEAESAKINNDNIIDQIKLPEGNALLIDTNDSTCVPSHEAYLPPCNRSALSIQQAYRLFSIVSPDELDSLSSFAENMLNKKDTCTLNSKKFSKFLCSVIPRVKSLDIQKLEVLIVIDALIAFMKFSTWKLQNKEPVLCNYSSLLNKKLLDEFTVASSTGRCLPAYMRDKALSYIIVLLFIVNGYEMDIKFLTDHIGVMDYKRLPLLLRAVGAKQSASSLTKYTLQLPLNPLPLPSNKSLKRKRT